MKKLRALAELGPAIVVAAVVLGPGSILTSSKVGAAVGPLAAFVVLGSTALMIGAVALAARIGVLFEKSPCQEIRARLGAPVAIAVGVILFGVASIFQWSNNVAVIAGIESIGGFAAEADRPDEPEPGAESAAVSSVGPPKTTAAAPASSGARSKWIAPAVLVLLNLGVIVCLFVSRGLYGHVERLMKWLILLMILSFLTNFVVALVATPKMDETPLATTQERFDWIPLLGMIGTTFSVGGAFYQAYLVKERGWGKKDLNRGLLDSVVGISTLGAITAVILLTAAVVFHGRLSADTIAKMQVADVARALEPLFGDFSRIVFGVGLLAGAFSSFLVNAMVGGTILSDSLGMGSRISERGPKVLTAAALLVGMTVAVIALLDPTGDKRGTANLITLAQSLTVVGLPALAAALLYLGFQRRPDGEGRVAPAWLLIMGGLGLAVSCLLAGKLASDLIGKLF